MGVLKISGKCSDLCSTEYTDKNGNVTTSDGYVPTGIGIDSYGDYIEIDIDMETGQILNWKPVSDEQVIKAQKERNMKTFGKFVAAIVMMIIGIIVGGLVLMMTWRWFIIPVFPSLPVLTLAQAIGINIFIAVLTAKWDDKDREFGELFERFAKGLFFIAFLLFIAWLVFLCIR